MQGMLGFVPNKSCTGRPVSMSVQTPPIPPLHPPKLAPSACALSIRRPAFRRSFRAPCPLLRVSAAPVPPVGSGRTLVGQVRRDAG